MRYTTHMAMVIAASGLWGCASTHRATDDIAAAPSGEEALARTATPVLRFPAPYAGRAIIIAERSWYALSFRDDEVTVYLHGTVAFVEPPEDMGDVSPHSFIRGVGAFDAINEDIRSISWLESGAAYSLEVECAGAQDVRCTERAFLADLAERLVADQ